MSRLLSRFAFLLLVVSLGGIAASPAHAQRVYYVNEGGAAANGGTSFADALPLQEALSQATGADAIVIAEGVYVPGSNEGDSFTITGSQDGLKVYGGWGGTESFTGVSDVQSRLDSRDLSTHRTILSGDLSGDDADPDGDGVIADAADIAGTNSFHLLFLDGTTGGKITTGTVIDGVTITAGQADGDFPHSAGGGLFCDGEGDPTYECSPTLRNLVFVGNRARGGGGAMNINGTFGGAARPILKNVIFDNNSAGGGGAIRNDGVNGIASPRLINPVFVGNEAENQGGAILSRGGDGTVSLQITNATFVGNTASEGGAVSVSALLDGTATLTLTNTILWGNTASSSGDEAYQASSSTKITAAHTIIQGGKNGIAGNGTVEFLNENGTAVSFANSTNLGYNPQFVDASTPAGADGAFATADDGLRPITASPAVNAGDNDGLDLDSDGTRDVTTDLLGGARVKNRNVSLGAYEVKDRARTLYVDTDATGANDGSSWTDAYTDLQSALAVATSNDEVWIAEGTYVPGDTTSKSFTITGAQDGLELYGGFGGSESSRSARDPAVHPTVLSGDIDGDDGSFAPHTDSDADTSTVTQTDHINGANSDHVLYLDGGTGGTITTSTVIDGVTVTGGRANGSHADDFGGGLYCAGGGSSECSPFLKNVIFAGNRADLLGGAIYNDGQEGSTSSPKIVNALFVGNSAENSGGAIVNDGYYLGTSSPVIVNSTFVDNESGWRGGAIANEGEDGTSSPRIVNTILWGNAAANGGNQIDNFDSTPVLDHSIVEGGANGVGGNSGSSTTFLDEDGTSVSFANSTNLDQNPQFVDVATPAGPDGLLGTADDGLRLFRKSVAAGAGDNSALDLDDDGLWDVTIDLIGATRVQGDSVNIGAYETVKDRARTLRVDADAMGANDGSSWADAYTDLQSALAVATDNDEIWIAEGTYVPADTTSKSFTITGAQDGLELYGGFSGGEATRSARDPAAHPTVLSGDIGGDDDAFAPRTDSDNDSLTPSQTDHINGQNSLHVLVVDGTGTSNVTSSTVIDGVTVTAGAANGSFSDDSGGGLYCMGSGSGNACSPLLRNVLFAGNEADRGGAVFNDGTDDGTASPQITNAVFVGNLATQAGGSALYNDGGNGVSSPQVTNAVFVDNRSEGEEAGGTLYNDGSEGSRTRFGTSYDGESNPHITNVTFFNNSAEESGGAIFNDGGGTSGTPEANPLLTNVILSGNSALEGNEIYNDGDITPTLSHSLVEGGMNGISENNGSDTRLLDDDGSDVPFANSTNLDQVPQFVDAATPAGADGAFGTADDGLRLTPGSPAIARGTYAPFEAGGAAENVTTDIAGRARRFGLTPDMGAYELHTITSTSADIADASGLLGYLDPSDFGGTVLLRDNAASSGGLQLERTNTEPAGTGLPSGVAPYTWTVTSELDAPPTYDLILETGDVPGIEDFASLMVYVSEDGGQTWDPADIEGVIVRQEGRNLVAVEGLTGGRRFAIGSASDPLPVELASFEGASTDEGVRLTWQTASETGNAGFEIQRRAKPFRRDGAPTSALRNASSEEAWQTVGSVAGSGTTTEAQSYRFTDADLPYAAEVLTYRLKQVDTDGTVSYSEEITVDRSAVEAVELLGTAPNPARSEARVRFAVPEAVEGVVTLRLYDLLGRQVQTVRAAAEAGRHEQRLDVSGLPSGVYFLRLRAGATVKTQRMTVVR